MNISTCNVEYINTQLKYKFPPHQKKNIMTFPINYIQLKNKLLQLLIN